MEFAVGIPVGILFAVGLFLGLHFGQPIPKGAPQSLYVWLVVACLIAGLVVAGWHTSTWGHRAFGVVAIFLAVLSAGSSVNQTFQYYPTLDRLFGKTASNFINNSSLNTIRDQVRRTGKLPEHGATLSVSIPATHLNYRPRAAYVWIPPEWFAPSAPKLPVIVMLHGTPGDPSDWTRASFADSTAQAFAAQHKGMAPMLVMPDVNGAFADDTECVNSAHFGDVENYLTQDVPAFMQKNFNANSSPGAMAVAGLSEGGTCALMLALTNPKLFPTFASYSGFASPTYQGDTQQQTVNDLFGGSQAAYQTHDPLFLLSHQRFPGMAGWFETGLQDGDVLKTTQTLLPLATAAGIDTCFASPPGTHNFGFWQAAFAHSLPWLSWRLKVTPQPQNLVARCTPGHP